MSAIWRAAVDWHATTLNPALSAVLSHLANDADDGGALEANPVAVAWKSRTDIATARKAILSLAESGHLSKRGPRRYLLNPIILRCMESCICPIRQTLTNAPGTTIPVSKPSPAAKSEIVWLTPTAAELGTVSAAAQITVACEMAWRDAFRTEPAPGLIRGMVNNVANQGAWEGLDVAFREYLTHIKPMYLNLAKFESTWRAYLEPAKLAKGKTTESEAAFAKVFGAPDEKAIDGL